LWMLWGLRCDGSFLRRHGQHRRQVAPVTFDSKVNGYACLDEGWLMWSQVT
jgi:hypothetical protein